MIRALLLASLLSTPGDYYFHGTLYSVAYTVDYIITAGAATLGPSAPGWATNDSAGGLGFDPVGGEEVVLVYEIPDCWDGSTDFQLKIYWFVQNADAIQNGETVQFDFTWRSLVWNTEDVDNGTAEVDTNTYTEAASPGDDDDTHISTMTLVVGSGNQTVSAGDTLTGILERNPADTYSGEAIFALAELSIAQTKIRCDHY